MAVADEIAAQAAKDALAKEMEGKFNYIGEAYTQAQEAAKANTQNVLNQLTQKATDYQTQFGKDTRSAYINKMERGQKLEGELSRLGLGNTGYGVTQRLMNDAAYGNNLADLQMALNQNLAGIDQAKATAGTDLGNTLADLAMKQADKQTSINQYIFNQLQDAYDKAYARSYQERQDAEQAAARYYSGGGGSSYSRSSSGSSSGYNKNYIYTDWYEGPINSDAKYGTFSTKDAYGQSYQPNNLGKDSKGNVKYLKPSGKTVGQMFGKGAYTGATGANIDNQNVWTYGKNYYIWDGSQNQYIKVS